MHEAELLFRGGRLSEALQSLQGYLRDNPAVREARVFLFELLLFEGELDRAGKQLALLAADSKETGFGVAFYAAALNAEKERRSYYQQESQPSAIDVECGELRGRKNGVSFSGIFDADSRLGAALEFFSAGAYHRLPFRYLKSLEIEPPRHLRDLCWVKARVRLVDSMGSGELDPILVPVLYPESYLCEDDAAKLGRVSGWMEDPSGQDAPCGQRLLIIGGDEVPLLDVRRLELDAAHGTGEGRDG
jgi:type VI secretion system protein ImpE